VSTAALRERLGATGASLVYLSTGVVVGAIAFPVLLVLLVVGVLTAGVLVGLPILAAALALCRVGANAERARAALVLGAAIERPAAVNADHGSRWRAHLRDRRTWRELAYMLLLGPAGALAATVAIAPWALAAAALAAPALRSRAPAGSPLGDAGPAELVLLGGAGLAVAALALVVTPLAGSACARIARALLAPDERTELARRVEALEVTRAAAVESSDARLRRIERDLHDGAQHRLTYIAMELDRARGTLADDPARADALLERAHAESRRALGELRDLVRGIHPSVLTDRGLDAAISGLAERSPVPVDVDVELGGRPRPAAETAAYYVIAEALTNVGKHAGASAAAVRVRNGAGELVVEISDDGAGGARRVPGSGLDGLAQRVEALDGTFSLRSPSGGPTVVRAVIPCGS
jgi:signal transduction histidine kinase